MAELNKSWYVKYRPKTLEDYSGEHIKRVVSKRFVKREDMPHVIFIHGTRGCGKTTFARLISKFYLCENPNEDGTPCEKCQACEEINETLIGGESGVETAGVTEVDATTANGKEAIQEVMEDAIVPPMYTEFKILILDEFHMVTPQAQNSMLKIIEDIPAHLVVIIATTNPEKVLQTIKSRCQLTLEARKQSIPDMVNRLKYIALEEKCTFSEKALEVIAKKGDRVPRECINLLENVAKNYDGEITLENVKECLGDNDSALYIEFFNAANTGLIDIMNFIYKLRLNDIKINEFVNNLMIFVLDALYIKHGVNEDEYTKEYVKQVKKLFDEYESQDFDMLLQVLESADRSLSVDNDKKNEVTLTIAAIRVGKIQLLSGGLAEEQETAIAENRMSMAEHHKLLKQQQTEVSEQLKLQITPALIKEEFEDAATVMDNITLPKIDPKEFEIMHQESKVVEEKVIEEDDDIDSFFDN